MSVISIDRGTSGAYWKYNAAVISNNDVGRTQRICLILVVHLKKFTMMIDIIMIIDINETLIFTTYCPSILNGSK